MQDPAGNSNHRNGEISGLFAEGWRDKREISGEDADLRVFARKGMISPAGAELHKRGRLEAFNVFKLLGFL